MKITLTSYSDWCKDNTGIFYQLNKIKPLPFVTDDKSIADMDTQFLLENANKQMVFTDANALSSSLLTEYFDTWKNLTEFYKIIPVGVTSESSTTSNSNYKGADQVALNNSTDMYNISGNNSNSANTSNTQVKNYGGYKKFILSSNYYDIIRANIRNYIFINIY